MEPAGQDVPIVWRGRRATAFVPSLLANRDLRLDAETVAKTARAQVEVEHGAAQMPPEYTVLARLLLRAEGVASSFIEGITAPVVDIVLAEQHPSGASTAAAWIAANLTAASEAIDSAHAAPLSQEALCSWHRTLMTGSPLAAAHVGVVRTEQGWVGGTSPFDAHLVTPPPAHLPTLLEDLVHFANRDDLDPVAQAALAHAQFEVIHPFADGNGRVGRILIAWILVRRLALLSAPPVSSQIATDVGGYTSGLTMFRLGEHERWVRWFADAVSGAGQTQQRLAISIQELQAQWQQQLDAERPDQRRLRRNSAAWRVLDLIPRYVVLTAGVLEQELSIPRKSAHAALQTLVSVGVLTEQGTLVVQRGRAPAVFVSAELLGLVGSSPLRR